MIRLLYQRGQFDSTQTPVVAAALAAFSAGLVFNGAMLMLNRAFFSLQLNWLPTAVALSNLALNALLDFAFYRLGVWGIPLATAAVNVAGTAALLILLRRRIGLPELPQTAKAVLRITVASIAVAVVGYAVWWPLDDLLGRSLAAQIVSLGTALVAASVAYLAACSALGVREMQALLSLRGRRRTA
jgi:putative peptidoglycan lipid II flippase